MASFSSPLTVSANTLIRLPSPLPSGAGQAFEVRPIPGVVPPPPLREEPQARQSRQDLTEDRGRARRTDQAFGRSRPQHTPAPSFVPEDFATSGFLAQILGQNPGSTTNVVALHRDGPTLGSEAYRRAGGEPAYYSEQPRILRIAV